MRYAPNTVGNRWPRLRKALVDVENDRVDDELSDWHPGEVSNVQRTWHTSARS